MISAPLAGSVSPPAGAHKDRTRASVAIDWIRFLAAFLVVLRHARPDHWVAWGDLAPGSQNMFTVGLLAVTSLGHEAVIVFFVLSGYLIGGQIMRRYEQGTFEPSDFFRDRGVRILTPLLPALGLTALCVWLVNGDLPENYHLHLVANVFQLQGTVVPAIEGNAPLWTLCYEVWLYLFAGAAATLALSVKGAFSPARFGWSGTLFLITGVWLAMLDSAYVFSWLIGAASARVSLAKLGRWSWLIGLPLGALGTCLRHVSENYTSVWGWDARLIHSSGILMVALATALLLPRLMHHDERLADTGFARWGTRLAAFSYTLYLTHFPLLVLMRSWHEPFQSVDAHSVGVFAAKVFACVLAAWLFYLPFERNTPKVRRFLRGLLAPSLSACGKS